jgi:ankyrin repeat protein
MTFPLIYLQEVVNRLEKFSQKQGINLEKLLDDNHKELNNIPLIHHIFDSYLASQNKQDKKELLGLVQNILKKGADPNVINLNSDTLFHRAIREKELSFINILIEINRIKYEKVNTKSGKTLLDVCLEEWPELIELIRFLSQKNNDELQTKFLNYISDYQDCVGIEEKENAVEKKIKFLIEKKLIDFNKLDSNGLLPLHLLCSIGNANLINLVLNSLKEAKIQIDPNKQDSQGNTALHILCLIGNINLINLVLNLLEEAKIQIDFNKQNSRDNTALHLACHQWSKPNLKIIKYLLEKGTDPNIINKASETAAHIAIENNNVALIQLLLKHNADFTLPDNLGRTPLMKMLTRPELTSNIHALQLLLQKQPSSILPSITIDPIKLAYEKGFWIRQMAVHCRTAVNAIQREAEILTKREKLTSKELSRHNPQHDIEKNPEYCYSPATFVKAGIPIPLFKRDEGFGVIIQTDNLIPGWCSGLIGEIRTETEVDFNANKLKFKYGEEHVCQDKTSSEIALQLQRLYRNKKFSVSICSALEKYNAIINLANLGYNEGLFRYKKTEIMAFYIAENAKDAFYGLELRKTLELNSLPFYTYTSNGSIAQLDEKKVCQLAKTYNHGKTQTEPENTIQRKEPTTTNSSTPNTTTNPSRIFSRLTQTKGISSSNQVNEINKTQNDIKEISSKKFR